MKKIGKIIEKILTKEVILYIAFGILTTIVNLGSFYVMNSILQWNENISNIIAILLAVIFAYITNKDLVFHSEADSFKERIIEFGKFMLGRAFTMVVEFVGGLILFELPIPNIITKMGLTIIVIILNFFISKFFAFKSKKDN
ncbi:MAG TPA: GtrA family protein [Clostridiaceae bacterium]|jgi:putative flippase GtrA|nr:GtrA family protein [Clostridiaceae bacterium]